MYKKMRMNHRFRGMGKTLLGVACLLSTCGITYSCSDDFDLDDTKPSFLGQSIYSELQKRKFTTMVRLIDDLGYRDVMSKTGSKTLFAAPDSAFDEFFKTTTWTDGAGNRVDSYDKLSTAQKLLLLNGAQLNNAYVLEMLTTIQGPTKNLCLRQEAGITATDSVPYFKWDQLPNNQNKGQEVNGKVANVDNTKKFWDRYRQQSRGGLYLALDGTEPLMTHFLEAQLNEKNITHGDVSFIMNLDGTSKQWKDNDTENRSYVYNSQIVEGDVTCLNGYIHIVDKVVDTPSNMAEVIRTNGDTKLFSLLLDRFSAPYYDATLTEEYKALHTISADSVFRKIYVAQRSSQANASTLDPDGNTWGDFPALSYDPGWNRYTVNGSTKEQDMAAMFVPSDEAMRSYFLPGGAGAMLIDRYSDKPNTVENLEYNLYQIPLNIVKTFVANLMKDSFNESVPSKYKTIMNDAQDAMFANTYSSVDAYKKSFKKVLMANNGVVYVMNGVVSPATFASVMAPALYNKNAQVMNTIIHADDNFISSDTYTNAPLRKFYSTYLLAMQSNFSLFLPTDDGLKNYGYIDPITYAANVPTNFRYWTLEPEEVTTKGAKTIAVKAQGYKYNVKEDIKGDQGTSAGRQVVSNANNDVSSNYGRVKKQIAIDMMDQHIVVHETSDDGEKGFTSGHRYYLSRSGAPVYVAKQGTGTGYGTGMKVEGGLQVMLGNDAYPDNDFTCDVTLTYDMTRWTNKQTYGNGFTYFINRPMQPTFENTYMVLRDHDNFSKFFEQVSELTSSTSDYVTLLETLFKTGDMTNSQWTDEQNKYMIFSAPAARPTANGTSLVRFFNNYRYTVYVPSNEAMEKALRSSDEGGGGLPTIESIRQYVTDNTKDGKLDPEAKVKAQAMVTCMVNFYKYHFSDQSIFLDNYANTTTCQTACSDAQGNYVTLDAKQGNGSLAVVDATGRTTNVVAPYNLMARDFELEALASRAYSITSSSYVVVHALNNYLVFDSAMKDHFDNEWKTVAAAKRFMKHFPLRK